MLYKIGRQSIVKSEEVGFRDIGQTIDTALNLVKEFPDSESTLFILAAALKEALVPTGQRCNPDEVKKHPQYPLLIDAFDRLVDSSRDEPVHRWNRAMLRQSLGLLGEAIEDLQVFVEKVRVEDAFDDDDYRSWLASAYDHLGCDLLGIGNTEAALDALQKAIEFDPGYSYAWEDLCTVFELLGEAGQAEECLRMANRIAESHRD